MIRSFILLLLLFFSCSCFRASVKSSIESKQQKAWGLSAGAEVFAAGASYQVKDIGLVTAKLYTYKGQTSVFMMSGSKCRYIIKVDSLQEFMNKKYVPVNHNLYKRRKD